MSAERDWRVGLGELATPTETRAQRIDFVIQRQTGLPSVHYLESLTEEERDALLTDDDKEERNARFASLESTTDDEFQRRYEQECRELQRELELYCAPADDVTLREWARKDAWHPTEALSLWLGCSPRSGVDLAAWARRNRGLTKAAAEILKRQELIERALWVGALVEPLSPALFVQWAMLKIPDLLDVLKTHLSCMTPDGAPNSKQKCIPTEVEALQRQIERLTNTLEEVNKPYYQLSVRLFAALCVDIYGFQPEKKRNKATRVIAEILEKHENERTPKTVLSYIRFAIAMLPQGEKKLAMLGLDGA